VAGLQPAREEAAQRQPGQRAQEEARSAAVAVAMLVAAAEQPRSEVRQPGPKAQGAVAAWAVARVAVQAALPRRAAAVEPEGAAVSAASSLAWVVFQASPQTEAELAPFVADPQAWAPGEEASSARHNIRKIGCPPAMTCDNAGK